MSTFYIKHFLKKWLKIILILLIPILIVTLSFSFVYVESITYKADNEFLQKILKDENIVIKEESDYYSLTPKDLDRESLPIIYYTGGLVKPNAYLYKLGQVAINLKKKIFVLKPFLNLTIINNNQAKKVIDNEKLDKVILAGHSLGAISACRMTKDNLKVVELFLLGGYCDADIANSQVEVNSVIGKKDGILNWDNYYKSRILLPSNTHFYELEDFNHSDFANYGLQKNDTGTNSDQLDITKKLTAIFSKTLKSD